MYKSIDGKVEGGGDDKCGGIFFLSGELFTSTLKEYFVTLHHLFKSEFKTLPLFMTNEQIALVGFI